MGTRYLSDAIDYKRDIEPNFFVQIFAGVGSGKNYLIESMIKGELKDCPKQTVLLITSRKAKVQETLTQFRKNDEESGSTEARRVRLFFSMRTIKSSPITLEDTVT